MLTTPNAIIIILPLLILQIIFTNSSSSSSTPICTSFTPPSSTKQKSMTKKQQQQVLVIGANGQTGKRIIQLLNQHESYNPIAMIRHPNQKSIFDEMGISSILADLRYPMDHILQNIDVVIFTAGGRTLNNVGFEGTVQIDLAGAIRLISSCQASKQVKRFIMLSGINVGFDSESGIRHWHKAKAYADVFLRDSDSFGRHLDWTIVCPSSLNNDPLVIRGGEEEEEGVGDDECVSLDLAVPAIVHSETHFASGKVGNSSRDLVALALVAIIDLPNTFGKSFSIFDAVTKPDRDELVVDGVKPEPKPLGEALASL